MSESPSWLMRSAAKSSGHRRVAGRLAIGLGVVALVLAGPAHAESDSAQDSATDVRELIPLPEIDDLPPPTAADFDRAAADRAAADANDKKIEALIPVPEPAEVPVLTEKDFDQLTPESINKLTGKELVRALLAKSLSGADIAVAAALRETLAGRFDRLVSRRSDRQALEIFYRDRGFAPVWIENGARAARATAAIRYLDGIDAHGFEPADYPVPHFPEGDSQKLAEAELQFTSSILDYARHARTGRLHFSRLAGDVHYDLDAPDPGEVLAGILAATDVAAALDAYQPRHPQYAALKAKLAEARREAGVSKEKIVRVPPGPTLKPGMTDARVALLRQRLDIPGEQDNPTYDDEVAAAVAAFQKGAGLVADGLAGPATLRALNGAAENDRVGTIIVNMERWRWLPRNLGRSHVIVNIPDFTLSVTQNGRRVWGTRIITGRIGGRETPLISTAMRSITVNPIWNVPQSIIAKDYLPALHQDPTVMDRMGIRIEQNPDGSIRMYQPPGDGNALGRLRFNTPNQFLVYLHDTPDKKLFEHDQRTFSAGCMRVQDPLKFAEVVMSIVQPDGGFTQERVRRLYGDHEMNLNFPNALPVHITYQTAWVDEGGRLRTRPDVYGHDARMIATLGGAGRQVADVAVPKPKATYSREELRLPSGVYYGSVNGGRRYGGNPIEDFFRSIFR